MAASRYSIRSARMLRAPIKAPIRADARQIRLQSNLPSQNSVPAAGSGGNGFAGGIAGGALVFALGYGYYHYSGAKSIVDGAAATKKQFQNVRASMKDKAPQPNELLKWFRNVATSYVAFIPGAKPYVDSVFNDIDAVEIKHRGKVDEILRDAYSEMMEETKGELTMETAQKTWEILQKYLKKLTELAGNASSEILDNHPHLKEKVGGNIEQLKQMAESYGPEAKKELNKTYDQIKDIVSTSSGTNVADKIRKAVEESMERLKKIGDEAWKKGIEKAQPYLNKNPEIKKIVEENADSLKRQNFDELFEKIKNGDASDIKDYVRKAGEKSKNSGMGKSIHEYITMIPGGQEILPNLEKLQGAVKKHGGEAEKIAKDAYKEISEILSKKADEVEKLAEEAKEEARK